MAYKDLKVRKEKSAERWKSWAKRNPERANARMREWRHRNPEYMLHLNAKRRATKVGLEFSIDISDIKIPDLCPVACIPIYPRKDGKQGPCDNSPTLDRIDPTKGYIKGNISVLSHKGNRWKNEMTVADVERLLKYMNTAPGLEGSTVNDYAEGFKTLFSG